MEKLALQVDKKNGSTLSWSTYPSIQKALGSYHECCDGLMVGVASSWSIKVQVRYEVAKVAAGWTERVQ